MAIGLNCNDRHIGHWLHTYMKLDVYIDRYIILGMRDGKRNWREVSDQISGLFSTWYEGE